MAGTKNKDFVNVLNHFKEFSEIASVREIDITQTTSITLYNKVVFIEFQKYGFFNNEI